MQHNPDQLENDENSIRGASAEAMHRHLTGQLPLGGVDANPAYPRSIDDFQRCLELLNQKPEWRERIPDLAALSTQWEGIAKNWEALERAAHERGWAAASQELSDTVNTAIDARMHQSPAYEKTDALAERVVRRGADIEQVAATLPPEEQMMLANQVAQKLDSDPQYHGYHLTVSDRAAVMLVAADPFGPTAERHLSLRTVEELPHQGAGMEITLVGPDRNRGAGTETPDTDTGGGPISATRSVLFR